jgi:integral membrane protein
MQWFKTSLGRLRMIGWWEGASFLLLLGIAMPLKYYFGRPEYVRVVGMAHGVLFLLYLAAAWQAAMVQEWTWRRTALVFLASLLPAGPFVLESKLLRGEEPRD